MKNILVLQRIEILEKAALKAFKYFESHCAPDELPDEEEVSIISNVLNNALGLMDDE